MGVSPNCGGSNTTANVNFYISGAVLNSDIANPLVRSNPAATVCVAEIAAKGADKIVGTPDVAQ